MTWTLTWTPERIWVAVGFAGQAIFTARFVVQWIASERRRNSVMPVAFWWLSLVGGLTLLCYVVYRRDPVLIVGQGMGLVVYARNLMLVAKANRRAAEKRLRDEARAAATAAAGHRAHAAHGGAAEAHDGGPTADAEVSRRGAARP